MGENFGFVLVGIDIDHFFEGYPGAQVGTVPLDLQRPFVYEKPPP